MKDISITDEGNNIVLTLNTEVACLSFKALAPELARKVNDLQSIEIEFDKASLNKIFVWAFGHNLTIESALEFEVH